MAVTDTYLRMATRITKQMDRDERACVTKTAVSRVVLKKEVA